MTTWMLVFAICFGCNSGQTVILERLPSYDECTRVAKELEAVLHEKGNREWLNRLTSKRCIEVKTNESKS